MIKARQKIKWLLLIHFWLIFTSYTPWKYPKTFGFLVFSGDIKWVHWPEISLKYWFKASLFQSFQFMPQNLIQMLVRTIILMIVFSVLRYSHQSCSIKKGFLKHFAKFTGKKMSKPLGHATLLRKRLPQRCFFVNFTTASECYWQARRKESCFHSGRLYWAYWTCCNKCENHNGSYDSGVRNKEQETILQFCAAINTAVGNTLFKKRESPLTTNESTRSKRQLDYRFGRRDRKIFVADTKVLPRKEYNINYIQYHTV